MSVCIWGPVRAVAKMQFLHKNTLQRMLPVTLHWYPVWVALFVGLPSPYMINKTLKPGLNMCSTKKVTASWH